MSDRRAIQRAHEQAQVAAFVAWLNKRYCARFEVIAEPDPPEAIIRSGRTTRWVEVTNAYFSDEFAQDELSYATPGAAHKPMAEGLLFGPDTRFAARFVDVVRKKLEKSSYLPTKREHGPGYLLVPIMYPAFDTSTLQYIDRAWSATKVEDLGCFRSVYMRLDMGHGPIRRWTRYRG